jgi:hypothetical protein
VIGENIVSGTFHRAAEDTPNDFNVQYLSLGPSVYVTGRMIHDGPERFELMAHLNAKFRKLCKNFRGVLDRLPDVKPVTETDYRARTERVIRHSRMSPRRRTPSTNSRVSRTSPPSTSIASIARWRGRA